MGQGSRRCMDRPAPSVSSARPWLLLPCPEVSGSYRHAASQPLQMGKLRPREEEGLGPDSQPCPLPCPRRNVGHCGPGGIDLCQSTQFSN